MTASKPLRRLVAAVIPAASVLTCLNTGCTMQGKSPRLVTVMVVDMFPTDYLDRFGGLLGNRGFKRIMANGANFTNAYYSHAATLTGPGHATIVTGTTPDRHGIVANDWFPRGSKQSIECVDDDKYMRIGTPMDKISYGYSPKLLMAPTLGDQMKAQFGDQSKVWSCSLKARAAILPGGQSADGAFWWADTFGHFVSSQYYFPELPLWCRRFNNTLEDEQESHEKYADRFFHTVWDRVLPPEAYAICDVDDAPYEQGQAVLWLNDLPKQLGKGFPEPNNVYYMQLTHSPFGNDLVLEMARQIVENESLGQDDVPDLLTVSLSSTDKCGHLFGPDSQEMLDMIVRLDRQIASWLDYLDKRVGLDRTVLVLTGDHGVAKAPERAKTLGLGGGRIELRDMFKSIEKTLTDTLGSPGEYDYWLTGIDLPWVWLNETVLQNHGVEVAQAARIVADAAKAYEGVEDAVVVADVVDRPQESLTPLARAVSHSVYDGRSGQVFVQLKSNWYRTGSSATGHMTWHPHNTHVPLMFMGAGIKKLSSNDRVAIEDVAPTLAAVLNIDPPPAATGRVLKEALRR